MISVILSGGAPESKGPYTAYFRTPCMINGFILWALTDSRSSPPFHRTS
jgi:hypothetical protein